MLLIGIQLSDWKIDRKDRKILIFDDHSHDATVMKS